MWRVSSVYFILSAKSWIFLPPFILQFKSILANLSFDKGLNMFQYMSNCHVSYQTAVRNLIPNHLQLFLFMYWLTQSWYALRNFGLNFWTGNSFNNNQIVIILKFWMLEASWGCNFPSSLSFRKPVNSSELDQPS